MRLRAFAEQCSAGGGRETVFDRREFVAQAGAPFAESLTSIELTGSDVPVYANATGAAYPERSTDARELLASQ